MLRIANLTIVTSILAIIVGCGKQNEPAQAPTKPVETTNSVASVTDTNIQFYTVKGVIKDVRSDFKSAKIRHEAVPGFMPAMTMDFEVRNTNELVGLKTNDVVSFRMNVTENDAWIDQVQKLSATAPTEAPSRSTVRIVRDVEPLSVGDSVPEYHFTNEVGKAVNLSDFKGKAVALTFIFTSCPYPTFCPRMSQNFAAVQRKLKETQDGPTNWQLLSITFDVEKDTPPVLQRYAKTYNYDPNHWSFLTGDLIEITAIAEQFKQQFWREGETISHNLRTVVIDPQGKVQKIFEANEWTPDELASEIVTAATKK